MATDSGTSNGAGSPLRHMKLGEVLGRGNMGAVYAATVSEAAAGGPQKIVVRILSSRFYSDPGFINRFYLQANAARRLRHPNIVSVLDVAEIGGRHCLAMELVDGMPLDKWMIERGKLPEPKMLLIASAVANALQHAWQAERLVHRAVRPQNIFMCKSGGMVLIADLGLAREAVDEHGHRQLHMPVNDPHYTAPELTLGEPQTEPSGDIYALGATLYHLATRKAPFAQLNAEKTLLEQRTGTLPDAKTANPDLSEGFCMLLEKMLARRPEDRHADYAALIAELRTLAGGGRLTRPALAAGASVMARGKGGGGTVVATRIDDKRSPKMNGAPTVKAKLAAAPVKLRHGSMPPPPTASETVTTVKLAHHHPHWMTTPMVVGAWIMVFILSAACWFAWKVRAARRERVQWEFDSKTYAKPTTPAPTSAGERSRRALEDAQAYEKQSPQDLPGIIQKYERVAELFPGTTPSRTAEKKLETLRARQPAASAGAK